MTLVLAFTVVACWMAVSLIVVGLCVSAARGDVDAFTGAFARHGGPAAPEWADLAAQSRSGARGEGVSRGLAL